MKQKFDIIGFLWLSTERYEVYNGAVRIGETSDHRRKVYLKRKKEGKPVSVDYLLTNKPYFNCKEPLSKEQKEQEQLAKIVREIIPNKGEKYVKLRASFMYTAKHHGVDFAKEKYKQQIENL